MNALLSICLEPMCILDMQGNFHATNASFERMFGYEPGELVGRPYALILHPSELTRSRDSFVEVLDSGCSVEDLTRCVARDGTGRWVQWRACRMTGQPLILASGRDVTHRRPVESLAETGPRVGAWMLGPDDGELFWSEEVYRLLDMGRHERPTLDRMLGLCLAHERPRLAAALEAAREQGQPFELQLEALTERGHGLWLRLTGERSGQRVLGIIEDVTRPRQELEGLQQSQWLLERAQELAQVGAWWSDPSDSGRLIWSRGCFAIFGHSPESFDGRVETFFALIHPEDRERVRSAGFEALAGGDPYDITHRVIRTDGEERWVHQKAEVLRDASGAPIQMVGLCQDITRQVQLQAQVLQAQKLESLGLLAGGVAHDFNNLLMAIIGNAGLARLELGADHPVAELLGNIETASEQAAELCRQMLAYSGRAHFVLGPVDLSELVREMSQLLKIGLSKKVALKLALDENLPRVEAEASQLRQVVMNLITNGSEAIGEREGTIELATRLEHHPEPLPVRHGTLAPGDYVVLEVRDSGSGMDANTLEKIFDPFFTTKFTGRGLGLAGVSGIVRGHQGGLEVLSRPGEGTVFRIYLPARSPAGRVPVERRSRELPRGQGRVLVVEDEPQVRRLACSILQRAGFEVLSARDGLEALALADLPSADLVLLDLAMPRLSGQETLARMREQGLTMPVILTSGHMSDDPWPVSWQPVFRLAKPYRPEELVREVLGILGSLSVPSSAGPSTPARPAGAPG